MRKTQKFINIAVATLLMINIVLPLGIVSARNTECGSGTPANACMYMDIYNYSISQWVPASITGNVGDEFSMLITYWNRSGVTTNNVTFKLALPTYVTYVPGTINFYGDFSGNFNQYDLFGAGINVGSVINSTSSTNGFVQLTVHGRVNQTPLGATTLTSRATVTTSNRTVVSATDTGTSVFPENNNNDSASVVVSYVDNTRPVITLNGTNPMDVPVNGTFIDPGATALDNYDGVIPVTRTGSVNTSVIGTYTLTYNATDSSGNAAIPVTRTVRVVDKTKPIITVNGTNPMTVQQGSVYTELGATVTDDVDPAKPATVSGSVNTAVIGTYTITYTGTDSAGNIATPVTRTVHVVDSGAPTIVLNGSNPMNVELGGTYVEPGATVIDNLDPSKPATVSGTVNTSVIGTYTITYTATDSAGNAAAPVTRTVNVVDTTKPTIILNGANPQHIVMGGVYTELGATVTDNQAGVITPTINSSAVNTAVPGTYNVYYNAVDGQGNAADQVIRTVIVDDNQAPVITLLGPNPQYVNVGEAYVEYGATVTDNQPTPITPIIDASGLNTNVVGTYTVYYNAVDGSGNHAAQVSRQVIVVGPTLGVLLINEVNYSPIRNWSTNMTNGLWSRGVADSGDKYVEFFVNQNGLDLTSANWTYDINGATGTLSTLGTYYYFSTTGGTAANTKIGDYLVIMPTNTALLTNSTSIDIQFLAMSVDQMSFMNFNNDSLDETIGRDGGSTDTNSLSDFITNVATPGRANIQPANNPYEAEYYTSTVDHIGSEIKDGTASNGLAVQFNSADDLNGGLIYSINSTDQQAAGTYKATLRLKSVNANFGIGGTGQFTTFDIDYAGNNDVIGHNIIGRDMKANGIYQDFTMEFTKYSTGGPTTFVIKFFNTAGANIVVDYLRIDSFTPISSPKTFEAEDVRLRAGYRVVDTVGGAIAVFGPKSEGGIGKHMSYGPYTASYINGLNSSQYQADFRIRATNISGAPTDKAVRFEVYDLQANIYRYTELTNEQLSAIPANQYKNFPVIFPSADQGSFQFRVVNLGTADIYYDKVMISNYGFDSILYEAENDFSYPNGAQVQVNALASGGKEVISTVAGNVNGFMQRGPFSLDQTGTGAWYKAEFRLRTNAVTAISNNAALIMVRDFDHGGRSLGHTYVPANMLSTDYRTFTIYFQSPASGRLSFDVEFMDVINVISDSVLVTKIAGQPLTSRVLQAEEMTRVGTNGSIVEDSAATNSIGHTTGYAVQATNGIDDAKNIIFSDSPETFAAGNYTAVVYIRKTNAGDSDNPIIDLSIKDVFGTNIGYGEYKESDLSTTYSAYTVNFTVSTSGKIFYKMYFNGGLGNSILIDKIEITKN